jgi:hypothetical protein
MRVHNQLRNGVSGVKIMRLFAALQQPETPVRRGLQGFQKIPVSACK